MSSSHVGVSPGMAVEELGVMVSRTVVALVPALRTPSGFPYAGGQNPGMEVPMCLERVQQ